MRSKIQNFSRAGRIVLALGVAGAAFALATAVYADIPDNGVIHGCYGKPGTTYKGQLRVRDSDQGEQCRTYENPLDWMQTGPTGATGAPGPTGPTGSSGPTGPSDGWTKLGTGTVPTSSSWTVFPGTTTGMPPGSYLIKGVVSWDATASG